METGGNKRSRESNHRMAERQLRLAEAFNSDVAAGIWKIGECLPSLCAFGKRYAVSYPAARKFYEWLKTTGRISTEPRRGAILLGQKLELPPAARLRQDGIAVAGWVQCAHPDAAASANGVNLKQVEDECLHLDIPLKFHNLWTPDFGRTEQPDIPPVTLSYFQRILDGNPAGVLLLRTEFADAATRQTVAASPVPVVQLTKLTKQPVPGCINIIVDERGGAVRATEHLLSLGHRKIGFLAYATDEPWMDERLNGYCDTLRKAGIAPSPDNVSRLPYDRSGHLEKTLREPGFQALDRLCRDCTAFLCASDAAGVLILQYGAAHGIPEPELPAFVTFGDNLNFRGYNMTAVRYGAEEQGAVGFRRLLQAIQHPGPPAAPSPTGAAVTPGARSETFCRSSPRRSICVPPPGTANSTFRRPATSAKSTGCIKSNSAPERKPCCARGTCRFWCAGRSAKGGCSRCWRRRWDRAKPRSGIRLSISDRCRPFARRQNEEPRHSGGVDRMDRSGRMDCPDRPGGGRSIAAAGDPEQNRIRAE